MNIASHSNDEAALVEKLAMALRALPDVQVLPASAAPGYDAGITLRYGSEELQLAIECKRRVFPADARSLLWRLGRLRNHPAVLPVIAAMDLSEGAKRLIVEDGAGYFDDAGNLFLAHRGLYIRIEKPPAAARSRHIRALFAGRRAQILHAFLRHPHIWLSVAEMAQMARVSAGTASETIQEMERQSWLESQGSGPLRQRRLSEPGKLLDRWAEQLRPLSAAMQHRFYLPTGRPGEFMAPLATEYAAENIAYAITHEAAAQLYTPYLSASAQTLRCWIRDLPGAIRVLQRHNARQVSEGANLILYEAGSYDPMLFSETRHGIALASPVQVYLDLIRGQGRARAMAEHLRTEALRF